MATRSVLVTVALMCLSPAAAIHLNKESAGCTGEDCPTLPSIAVVVPGKSITDPAAYFKEQTQIDQERTDAQVQEQEEQAQQMAKAEAEEQVTAKEEQIKSDLKANLPTTEEGMITHQFWQPNADKVSKKMTPGDACSAKTTCEACTGHGVNTLTEGGISGICTWVKSQNACLEDRDPTAVSFGTHFCGDLKTQDQKLLDSVLPAANEKENYQLFAHGKEPMQFSIASLNHGQDMYTVAKDQLNPSESENAQGFGAEIIDGADHTEFDPITNNDYKALNGAAGPASTFSTASAQPAEQAADPAKAAKAPANALVPV